MTDKLLELSHEPSFSWDKSTYIQYCFFPSLYFCVYLSITILDSTELLLTIVPQYNTKKFHFISNSFQQSPPWLKKHTGQPSASQGNQASMTVYPKEEVLNNDSAN